MSTPQLILARPLFSSVPQQVDGTAKDSIDEADVEAAALTLSSTHLRKLAVSVPAMVGEAIRSQLPLRS